MANKKLFPSFLSRFFQTDTVNEEGAPAYRYSPKHMLAQYACTGCLNDTFYVSADEQLQGVLKLCAALEPDFIARTAVYAAKSGYMKDLPALLCAALAVKDVEMLKKVFPVVIDNFKMVRNFIQIIRSGAVGRKSLGYAPKNLIRQWFARTPEKTLFNSATGNDPSMKDVIKMVHPKPDSETRSALYAYMADLKHDAEKLPEFLRLFEEFKKAENKEAWTELPDVHFQYYTGLTDLPDSVWKHIARTASWQTTRMNLNTFFRHGVLEDPQMVTLLAERLKDKEIIRKSRVFPYQLLMAYRAAQEEMPREIIDALHVALEAATENVPVIDGRVAVFPDTSGSMSSPVTGYRGSVTTKVSCVEVAALVTACILRKNPDAIIMPFDTEVRHVKLEPRDSIMTNAEKLALHGGGTACSAPLAKMNREKKNADVVIYISDNESWFDSPYNDSTETMNQWRIFKKRNPKAKLICIDITPGQSTQAKETEDVTNVGGFSDQVFSLIAEISRGAEKDFWVKKIEETPLDFSRG